MNIPDGVTNKKAYLKYIALSRKKIVSTGKNFSASDGSPINLAWFPHHLKKKIEHLPIDEQTEILEKKEEYFVINNNMTVQKRLAFGLKQGRGSTDNVTKSLLDTRGPEIIEYFGRLFTAEEVLKIINKDWGIKYSSINKLKQFRAKNAKEIEERIEKYKATYTDVRLSVKRSRLEELTYLFGKQKQKYEDTNSNDSYRLLLQTIESIRKESEGDRLTIEGKVDISYEQNLQEHLRNEIFRTLNVKEIILARVAARMGISPMRLIYSLNNSYYKKFSNVLGDFDPEEGATDAVYPSQMNYDFERIKKNQAIIDKQAQDVDFEEVKNDELIDSDKTNVIKEKMLAKLKAKRNKIGKKK